MKLDAGDVEAIERATIAAVAPLQLIEDDGWLLAANEGVIGRANSVTALAPGSDPLEAKINRALAFYGVRRLEPKFRLSPWSKPSGLAERLGQIGFRPEQVTSVMIADAARLLENAEDEGEVEFLASPDSDWRALFLGPGVAAAEAEKRTAALARGDGMRFAQTRSGGVVAAVGASNLAGVWAGVHGMRTALAHRRQGYARGIVTALVRSAVADGAQRIFLQVEADNAPAIGLYEGLGFGEAWRYAYWRQR